MFVSKHKYSANYDITEIIIKLDRSFYFVLILQYCNEIMDRFVVGRNHR